MDKKGKQCNDDEDRQVRKKQRGRGKTVNGKERTEWKEKGREKICGKLI